MKTKYYFIYFIVGAAFLAASAWVFFSRGKNAKAIWAKYRLGGIMLTCLAMLSAASCEHDGVMITCYDVAVEPLKNNIVSLSIKHNEPSYRYYEISPGDIFSISIKAPSFEKYILKVIPNNTEGTELQRAELVITDTGVSTFEVPLSGSVTYRGEAVVQIHGVIRENPEELDKVAYGATVIQIL
ncbi:MAG: hypothetical protein IJS91_01710 [Bacteroidales bacterium]|nr:hypothetical protein [Bacteroidales bacterium]